MGLCSFINAQTVERKPNILLVVADDASWRHFSAYGCQWVSTPAFDRVAKEGILFQNAYTCNSKSSPSRACMITGRNSWQLEEAGNHFSYFPAKFKTYPEVLRESGYWVGTTGKGWAPGDPGTLNGKKRELTGKTFNKYTVKPLTKGISNIDYVRNFEDFLQNRPDNYPFCFWFGSFEPHRDYEFASSLKYGSNKLSKIDKVPAFWPDVDSVRTDMLDYAFEIEYFDAQLQRMIEILEKSGELENTIIVVTSDNGMPFPRVKGQAYEYSNHMPLAIMWGKGIENPGRTENAFVSLNDLSPTFLEVAGVDGEKNGMQAIVGKNLTDIFQDKKNGKKDRSYVLIGKERHDVGRPHDQGYPIRGIIKGNYLYVKNYEPLRWPSGNPETGYLNVDGGATKSYILNMPRQNTKDTYYWNLNFGKRVNEELYDIKRDPECMNNKANDFLFLFIKKSLARQLHKELLRQDDPREKGNGETFDNYPYAGAEINFYERFMRGEKIPTSWVNDTDYEK
ncbi:MAG: heparan N-sulfatase [Porphyromonadaceae bacterium CG2_30_38_12]|nr:MAG: heparan N-sulfatase [Porphyromonadaceae bacterium CG2_30_38_12]